MTYEALFLAALFLIAFLYSSVGHGGASGYLALMALVGVAANTTRPTALMLNIIVASIAGIQFYRAGHFSWAKFWPFAAASVPMAFVGGLISLPTHVHKIVLGCVLLVAAARLAWNFKASEDVQDYKGPSMSIALLFGGLIGLLSGLTGVGGGIFLTPLLLIANWEEPKKAAGISAVFILVNSISGLAGNYSTVGTLSSEVLIWVAVAIAGGSIGSALGSRYFDTLLLRRMLSLVLVIAGLKLIFA